MCSVVRTQPPDLEELQRNNVAIGNAKLCVRAGNLICDQCHVFICFAVLNCWLGAVWLSALSLHAVSLPRLSTTGSKLGKKCFPFH